MTRHSRTPSLWRHHDFRSLWLAQSISLCGSQVTGLALPALAILRLHAGPAQVGLLAAVQWLPLLLLGPIAGVIIDRLGQRGVMVTADLARLILLATVPLASVLGHESMLHLYAVALLAGCFGVFFDVSYITFLPALVSHDRLMDGNAKLSLAEGGAQIAGPSLAGVLISVIGAGLAVLADACSFALSALFLAGIRYRPAARPETAPALRFRVDIGEAVGVLIRQPVVRAMVAVSAVQNLGSTIAEAVVLIFAFRTLHLSAAAFGVLTTLGSLTFLATTTVVAPLTRRLGIGRTLGVSSFIGGTAYFSILLGLAGPGAVAIGLWRTLYGIHLPTYNVNVLSARQALIPLHQQARVAALGRTVAVGISGIGFLLGGLLGSTIGIAPTILFGGIVFLLGSLPILTPAIISLRGSPEPVPLPA